MDSYRKTDLSLPSFPNELTGEHKKSPIEGILNINKPKGITSMDVVRQVKRSSRQKRVGHGGTLDPIASGVVPVCIGKATRMMEYLIEGTKEYIGEVELGVETNTYDAAGEVIHRQGTSSITFDDIEDSLESFNGEIEQTPPMFSALKVNGKRLYDLARSGIEIDRNPRKVNVISISVVDWNPPCITLNVKCGRGFYMRSLAHDLGQTLRCGAHLKELIRTRCGPFNLSNSIEVKDLDDVFSGDSFGEILHALDSVVLNLRALIVSKNIQDMLKNGRRIPLETGMPIPEAYEKFRVYQEDGEFLAIIKANPITEHWESERVFNPTDK